MCASIRAQQPSDNPWDEVNVNERVIVSAEDVAANGGGTWEIRVRSRDLATDKQTYSLVVTGAISPPGADAELQSVDTTSDADRDSSAASSIAVGGSPFLPAAVATLAVLLLVAF